MPQTLTNIGTTLHVSAADPATYNIAGYAALTWTEVAQVATLPELGPSAETLTFVPLKSGVTDKAHGAINYGAGAVQYKIVEGDAGQDLIEAARAGRNNLSVKITRKSGLIEYMQVLVMSNVTAEASASSTYMRTANVEVRTEIVYDDAGV